jgi:putative YjhG/YagF family dehydratase
LPRPAAADWARIARLTPRLVDALPNGPRNHPTVQVFLAGGVPEVMLHLRRAGLLETGALTVSGVTLGEQLDEWERSARRTRLRTLLRERDGVDPDDVIFSAEAAARRGITSTVCFPHGNLAPEGSVIKSTSIDPSVVGPDGVYRMTGPARVFVTEHAAITYVKSDRIRPGEVLVLAGRGPMGAGMEETYQITAALKYLSFGKRVALLTDARFSGTSSGACIGHVSPEALAGGPIGKLRDGDLIDIKIDRVNLVGSVNFVGENGANVGPQVGESILARRSPHPDLAADPALPDDTRLWAALQDVSGGSWGGSVFDTDAILRVLALGKAALAKRAVKSAGGS